MLKTVKEMYECAVLKNTALLSTYNGDFWKDYVENHKEYDRLFMRMFKSFKYFLQDGSESIDDVLTDFIEDVKLHLMVNSKKYSELYRTYIVNDAEYMLLDNYNVKETMSKQGTLNGSDTLGARADTTNDTIGAVTTATNTTVGAQTNSETNKVSPYDSDDFHNDTGKESTLGTRSDNGTSTINEHIDSSTFNKGEQIDTHNNTTKESYELTRKGNIGVQTGSEMLVKHDRFWNSYEFYTMIFKDICKELLLVN